MRAPARAHPGADSDRPTRGAAPRALMAPPAGPTSLVPAARPGRVAEQGAGAHPRRRGWWREIIASTSRASKCWTKAWSCASQERRTLKYVSAEARSSSTPWTASGLDPRGLVCCDHGRGPPAGHRRAPPAAGAPVAFKRVWTSAIGQLQPAAARRARAWSLHERVNARAARRPRLLGERCRGRGGGALSFISLKLGPSRARLGAAAASLVRGVGQAAVRGGPGGGAQRWGSARSGVHERFVEEVCGALRVLGFAVLGRLPPHPLLGPPGNREFPRRGSSRVGTSSLLARVQQMCKTLGCQAASLWGGQEPDFRTSRSPRDAFIASAPPRVAAARLAR